jgi:hypothetical protein
MTEIENRPFTPRMFAMALRGTKDEAMNGFSPEINLADPEGSRFGSSPEVPSQRWLAVGFSEEETELLLRITAMVKEDKEVSAESRFMADKINVLVRACIQNFETYEERKAADLPTSLPVAS